MSRHQAASAAPRERFPRVSGDEPEAFQVNGTPPLFSPRERG